jgi:putative ABC transport system substrate-binding protein
MKRREFIAAIGATAIWPLSAHAQKSAMPVIGLLHEGKPFLPATSAALEAGLREFGLIDGQTIRIEYRWAETQFDRLPKLAAELVALKPDLIISTGTPSSVTMKEATTAIPVVFLQVGDPVGVGLVQSLARPGGNMTGLAVYVPDDSGDYFAKNIELLRDAVGSVSRVAVLINPGNKIHNLIVAKDLPRVIQKLGVEIPVVAASAAKEFDGAFASAVDQKADAIIVFADGLLNRPEVAALATQHHLPSLSLYRLFARNGGLISYGTDFDDLMRRGGYFVDKILKGTKPADLPVQQPTKYQLSVNLNTAKALGLAIPPTLLARADEVIE